MTMVFRLFNDNPGRLACPLILASILVSFIAYSEAFTHSNTAKFVRTKSSSHAVTRVPSASSRWPRQHCRLASRANAAGTSRLFASSASAIATGNGLSSLIASCQARVHGDPTFVLSAVLLLSTFGVILERRTVIGKALSAPLSTMALALTVANLGIMPFSSPVYNLVNRFLVPLAVPMLLFDSDLRRVLTDTGSLLLAFLIGAISTVVGTLVAYPVVPLDALGPDMGWRVACSLAARHIGGAINFVAVADTLNVGGSAVSAAIAADNVVVALYFAFLFYLAKPGDPDSEMVDVEADMPIDPESVREGKSSFGSPISLPSLSISLAVSSCLVFIGRITTGLLLPKGTSSLPLTSVLTVTAATAFPGFFSQLRSTGTAIGIIFMQMFFAASGAAGSIQLVLRSAPLLFLFSVVQIGVHFVTLTTIGRLLFRLDSRELYLASNANVGGPTTAAAMAQAKNWQRLVLPGLLVGILGYASATPIALALGPLLLRLPFVVG